MNAFRNLLYSLCLLVGLVLIWDIAPGYTSTSALADPDPAVPATTTNLETAVFAGGCFWCMEPAFDHLEGVVATTSGYTGGDTANPTYAQVSAGGTGHREAVQVTYDPQQVSYAKLLSVFWKNVDPLDADGQFCDRGSQYRSAIFVANAAQRHQAEQSLPDLSSRFELPLATAILPTQAFYPAEEYHQDYYLKHPVRYKFYRKACGRDQRLHQLWAETP